MANSTHHTGRLTADPQLRSVGELQICDMRLAVQRRRGHGGEDRARSSSTSSPSTASPRSASSTSPRAAGFLVDGQLGVQEWTGQDGNKRWTPELIAVQVEFLDPAPARDSSTEAEPEPEPQPAEATA